MEIDNTAYTILVIDDDAPSLKVLLNHLQELGFKTLAARSGERGFDVARRSNPDLVLLDVMMPRIDGFSTCRQLKEDETTKNIPVIFLTALADTTNKIKGFEVGAVDYITKPIQNREVSARIYTHLRLHELTEHLEQEVQEQTQELITEIAERKQTEELLRESEEKYRQLVENANESVFVAQDGIFKLFNPKTLEITGYSRRELTSQPFAELIHPDDREMVVERHLQRLQGEHPSDHYVFRIINKGGSVRWVEIKVVLIDWEGKPATLNFLSDVTERVQVETAQRIQRDFVLALSSTSDLKEALNYLLKSALQIDGVDAGGVYLVDKQNGMVDLVAHIGLSSEFVEIAASHYDADSPNAALVMAGEFVYQRHSEVSPSTEIRQREGLRALAVLPVKYEEQVIAAINLASRNLDEFPLGTRNVLESIALQIGSVIARALAEDEVHRRNLELTLLNRVIAASATSPDAKTILGIVCEELALAFDIPQSSAILWNEEKSKATIVAEYQLEQQSTILNQDIPIEDNPIVQYLRTNKIPLLVEDAQSDPRFTVVRELLYQRGAVSLLILPILIEQEIVGSLNIGTAETRSFSDEEISLAQRVTEQVAGTLAHIRLDEQRRQLEEQLRQSQKMESIGRLAGGMAHDFNNLLTVITGYSELVLHRYVDKNDPAYRDVEQIYKAGERASALTRQLLAFSRQQVIKREILDLNTVITDMNKMLRRLVSEDIELIADLDPTLGKIKIDQGQIEQIIMNLVVNASDAMPQGGQLITKTTNVDVDEVYADLHLGLQSGPYVTLTISDTGIGMDMETRAQIFEPFFSTKEKGKGTGLGLATVYGIIQQNNGYIEVSSESGQGTTFQIYLPRFEQDMGLIEQEESLVDETPQGTETILLVEDEDMVRELVSYTLLQDGYNVLEAHHGQEALEICARCQDSIHLLLTDVVMPGGLSGHDLAEQLTLINSELKVLYMSGYVDDAIAQRGILNSDVAFLQKPFSPIDLSRKVREVLDLI